MICEFVIRLTGQEKNMKVNVEFPLTCKVGTIVKCEEHPTAAHLYVLSVDCGEDSPRPIVSALKPQYDSPEGLINRQVVILTNIRAGNFKGVRSDGMLLTSFKKKASILGVANGAHAKNGKSKNKQYHINPMQHLKRFFNNFYCCRTDSSIAQQTRHLWWCLHGFTMTNCKLTNHCYFALRSMYLRI